MAVTLRNYGKLLEDLRGSEFDGTFAILYGSENIGLQKSRYERIARSFEELYGAAEECGFFSAPGAAISCR